LPGASEKVLAEIVQVVRELASGHPSIERIEGLTDGQVKSLRLREFLGDGFDEFYYAHDSTGTICRRLAQAYPRALTVCIGDAFGMIYPTDFVAGYHGAGSIGTRLRAWLRAALGPSPVQPEAAALVLPVDPSGVGLRGVELVCCGKGDFINALRHCHANARDLREHMRTLLGRTDGRRRYLLLTENYSEAGHIGTERELQMYCEMLRSNCERGSVVIVKPHPLEAPGKAARMQASLGSEYEIISVEASFGRYPIEIWQELVHGCTVMCAGYPVLSLKYAYDINVVQPMDEAFVERWMEPAFQRWTLDSLRLYMEPLARLGSWDGRSVLWSPERG
jgi:hypothetical protein